MKNKILKHSQNFHSLFAMTLRQQDVSTTKILTYIITRRRSKSRLYEPLELFTSTLYSFAYNYPLQLSLDSEYLNRISYK